jgi:hypothetical protein
MGGNLQGNGAALARPEKAFHIRTRLAPCQTRYKYIGSNEPEFKV